MERSDAKLNYIIIDMQRATGQSQRMQLYRATLLYTRATKLREKNCRCDIGLMRLLHVGYIT